MKLHLHLLVISLTALSTVPARAQQLSAQQIFHKWSKAVVTVKTDDGSGTGFFTKDEPRVYTAYHVLKGAKNATIRLSDGSEHPVLGVVSADEDKDFAVLVTDTRPMDAPSLGNYAAMEEGEPLTVIGSPLGFEQTVTCGIVSSKRKLPGEDLLQLSAGVSPGSSGSPVFNSKGDIVGMVVSTLEGGQLLNFALSSKDLKTLSPLPLKTVFAEKPAPATKFGILHRDKAAMGRFDDLCAKGAAGYSGIKTVAVSVAEIPTALAKDISRGDVELWITNALQGGGLPVRSSEDSKQLIADAITSQTDDAVETLIARDRALTCVYFSMAALKSTDNVIAYSYTLSVARAGIVPPGWVEIVPVDAMSGVGYFGPTYSARDQIRSVVKEHVETVLDRWKYANRND